MATRRELIQAIAERYHAAARPAKKEILDEFVKVTGYHRKHAIRALKRTSGARAEAAPRSRLYDEAVRSALTILWEAADRICGKRLKVGRHAAENRKQRGDSKPEVFHFLGFTHMCGKTRKTDRFIVKRRTIRKRLSAKLNELKEELRRRWHQPVADVGKWLKSVVQGYFNYHAVPGNMDSLNSFRAQVIWRWYRALRRRSQRDRMTWDRFWPLVDRWIPSAKILHPHPNLRFDARYPR